MKRCLKLAQLGEGFVAPNPMVGAVLVYEDKIIGEGYHEQFGKSHAEVNCFNNVAAENREKIPGSTLYVSLEPCAHHGKTPPCADRIIAEGVKKVVIGCKDSFEQVNGKGIEKLSAAGIQIQTGVLEDAAKLLNSRFFTFHQHKRPYIVLKWARTKNNKIAKPDYSPLAISNSMTNRLVHQWRSIEAGIMVGTRTALSDNPMLTNRLWTGKQPVRIVLDRQLIIPDHSHLLDHSFPTIVFNDKKEGNSENLQWVKLEFDTFLLEKVMTKLYDQKVQSVMVEGGALLIQSFIDKGYWDEVRIITNREMWLEEGIEGPLLHNYKIINTLDSGSDLIQYFQPSINSNR